MVIAALMPTFVLFGWLAGRPGTARVGSLLAIYTSVQLALDSSYAADFSAFANAIVALMVGVGLTGAVSGIVRLFGAEWIASRLLRSNWRTLADVAEGRTTQDRVVIAGLMQHRLALLASRMALVPAETRSDAANLRQLRTALNIVNLRKAGASLAGSAMAAIDALLDRLASACRAHTVGRLPDELLGRLDEAVASILREPASESRSDALDSLAGIRTGLFPGGARYHPHEPEQRRVAA
jgi:uncharacterized membrane protein YccC